MRKTLPILIMTVMLSACGTIEVYDDGDALKRIERRGAAILSTSPAPSLQQSAVTGVRILWSLIPNMLM